MLSIPKVLVLAALLALLSTVACASMSLEDYAEECGDWEDDYGSPLYGTFSGSISDMEDALDDWNALSPPGEVKAIHDIRANALGMILETAREIDDLDDQLDNLWDEYDDARRSQRDDIQDDIDDLNDDKQDLLDDLWDRIEDLDDDFQDERDDLPRRVERELEDEDCI